MSSVGAVHLVRPPHRRRLSLVLGAFVVALLAAAPVPAVMAAQPSAPAPAPVPTPAPPPVAQGAEAVIAAARSYLGVPYRIGSEGPYLFDCSGLVFRAFADAGEQARIGEARLGAAGYLRWFAARDLLTTDAEQAQRGDLVVYGNGVHIGIYLGDGRVISALVTGVAVHSLGGITIAPTGFLAVDWSGERGPFKPGDAPAVPIADEPEAPAALVPAVPWAPTAPSEDVAAGPAAGGVERVDMRTANSRTFEDGDGHFTTEVFSRPIFYQPDGSTEWQPIDLSFQAAEGDSGPAALTSPARLSLLPADAESGFLSLSAGEHRLSLGLFDRPRHRGAAVPELAADGRYADYRDLIGPGIGLRVYPRADGFKAFLVLAHEPDANRFSFAVDAPGLSLAQEVDGTLTLRDPDTNVIALIPHALMLDSSDIHGDGGGVYTAAVSLGVADGQRPGITLTLDRAFLDEAVYPAYVDLTVVNFPTGSMASTYTFASSEHANANFSTYQRPELPGYYELWHGRQPGSGNDNEAYLRFGGLPEMLAGVTVESASLRAFPYWQSDHDGAPSSWVNVVTEPWDSQTLSWNARPASDAEIGEFATTQGEWSDIDLTAYVHAIVDEANPDYGLMLHGDGAGADSWKRFVAESGLGIGDLEPRLVVKWSGLRPFATTLSDVVAFSGVTLTWAQPGITPAATRYQVQVSADGFGSIVAESGKVRGAAAEEDAWIVPVDGLASGRYSWRVRAKYGDGTAWSDWSAPQTFTYTDRAEAWYPAAHELTEQ